MAVHQFIVQLPKQLHAREGGVFSVSEDEKNKVTWTLSVWRKLPSNDEQTSSRLGGIVRDGRVNVNHTDSSQAMIPWAKPIEASSKASADNQFDVSSFADAIHSLHCGYAKVTEDAVLEHLVGDSSCAVFHVPTSTFFLPANPHAHSAHQYVIRADIKVHGAPRAVGLIHCITQYPSGISAVPALAESSLITRIILKPLVHDFAKLHLYNVATNMLEAACALSLSWVPAYSPGADEWISVTQTQHDCKVVKQPASNCMQLHLACEPMFESLQAGAHHSGISAFSLMASLVKGDGMVVAGPFLLGGAVLTEEMLWKGDFSSHVTFTVADDDTAGTDVQSMLDLHLLLHVVVPPRFLHVNGVSNDAPLVAAFAFFQLKRISAPHGREAGMVIPFDACRDGKLSTQAHQSRALDLPTNSWTCADLLVHPGCPAFLPADATSNEPLFGGLCLHGPISTDLKGDADTIPWMIPAHLRLGSVRRDDLLDMVMQEQRNGFAPCGVRVFLSVHRAQSELDHQNLMKTLSVAMHTAVKSDAFLHTLDNLLDNINVARGFCNPEYLLSHAIHIHLALMHRLFPAVDATIEAPITEIAQTDWETLITRNLILTAILVGQVGPSAFGEVFENTVMGPAYKPGPLPPGVFFTALHRMTALFGAKSLSLSARSALLHILATALSTACSSLSTTGQMFGFQWDGDEHITHTPNSHVEDPVGALFGFVHSAHAEAARLASSNCEMSPAYIHLRCIAPPSLFSIGSAITRPGMSQEVLPVATAPATTTVDPPPEQSFNDIIRKYRGRGGPQASSHAQTPTAAASATGATHLLQAGPASPAASTSTSAVSSMTQHSMFTELRVLYGGRADIPSMLRQLEAMRLDSQPSNGPFYLMALQTLQKWLNRGDMGEAGGSFASFLECFTRALKALSPSIGLELYTQACWLLASIAYSLRDHLEGIHPSPANEIAILTASVIKWLRHNRSNVAAADRNELRAMYWPPTDAVPAVQLVMKPDIFLGLQPRSALLDSLFRLTIGDIFEDPPTDATKPIVEHVRLLKRDCEAVAVQRPAGGLDDPADCTPVCVAFLAAARVLASDGSWAPLRRVTSQVSVSSALTDGNSSDESRVAQYLWKALIRYGCALLRVHADAFHASNSELTSFKSATNQSPLAAYSALLLRLLLSVVDSFGSLARSRSALASARTMQHASVSALLKDVLQHETALKQRLSPCVWSAIASLDAAAVKWPELNALLQRWSATLASSANLAGSASPCARAICRNFLRYLQPMLAGTCSSTVAAGMSRLLEQVAVMQPEENAQLLTHTSKVLGGLLRVPNRAKASSRAADALSLGLITSYFQQVLQICAALKHAEILPALVSWYCRQCSSEQEFAALSQGEPVDVLSAPFCMRATLAATLLRTSVPTTDMSDWREFLRKMNDTAARVAEAVTVTCRRMEWDAAIEVLQELYGVYEAAASHYGVELPPLSTPEVNVHTIAVHFGKQQRSEPSEMTASSFARTVRPDGLSTSSNQKVREVLRQHAILARCLRTAIAYSAGDVSLAVDSEKIVATLSMLVSLAKSAGSPIPTWAVTTIGAIMHTLATPEQPPHLPRRYFAVVCCGPSFDSSDGQHLQPKWYVIEAPDDTAADSLLDSIRTSWPDAIVHGPDAPVGIAKASQQGSQNYFWVGSGTATEHVYGCQVDDTPTGQYLRVDMPLGPATPDHINVLPCYPTAAGDAMHFFGWIARESTMELNEQSTTVYVHPIGLQGPCLSRDKFNIMRSDPEVLIEDSEQSAVMRFHLQPDILDVRGTNGWSTLCVPAQLSDLTPQPLGSATLQWGKIACDHVFNVLTWFKSVAPSTTWEAALPPPKHSYRRESTRDLLQEGTEFDDGPSIGASVNQTLTLATSTVRQATSSNATMGITSPAFNRRKYVRDSRLEDVVEVDDEVDGETELQEEDGSILIFQDEQATRQTSAPQRFFRQPTVRQLALRHHSPEAKVENGDIDASAAEDGGEERAQFHDASTTRDAANLIMRAPTVTKAKPIPSALAYKPKLDISHVVVDEKWIVAPAKTLHDVPFVLRGPLQQQPARYSSVVPLHTMQRIVFAQLQDLLSPSWSFCTGVRVCRQLLQDYAELKATWCEKIVTEKRREWIREDTALMESGVDVSTREMPDFSQLVNRKPSPLVVSMENTMINFLRLTKTLTELFHVDLCDAGSDTTHHLMDLLQDVQTSTFAGFEGLAQV